MVALVPVGEMHDMSTTGDSSSALRVASESCMHSASLTELTGAQQDSVVLDRVL